MSRIGMAQARGWQAMTDNRVMYCLSDPTQPDADRDAALAMFNALQQQAHAAGLTLREPPPEPTSCCGRGCNGCVWEGYYSAVNYWREEALLMLQD